MKVTIKEPIKGGKIPAIPSKSMAHRLIIASALTRLTGNPCKVDIGKVSDDVEATFEATKSLLEGVAQGDVTRVREIHCKESGSTFRFLLPIAGALGIPCDFYPEKSLLERPIWPLYDEMVSHGCKMTSLGQLPLHLEGKMEGGNYQLPGNISSQYITALLMALPLAAANSTVEIIGELESAPYVDMTLEVLKLSGIVIRKTASGYNIPGGQQYFLNNDPAVEGDWSNAAFWMAMSPYLDQSIEVEGLNHSWNQGDKEIEKIIMEMYMQEKGQKMEINVANIPDLVPAIALAAAGSGIDVEVVNAQRLRLKESDRIKSIAQTLKALGGKVTERNNGLIIHGIDYRNGYRLQGGTVDSCGDHRIAMMAAGLSLLCKEPVTIENAQVVSKSYMKFFDDFEKLGGVIQVD